MRILLQNPRTKLYFCLLDMWTANPKAAFDFRHSRRALDFVNKEGLKEVQLVVNFDDPQWDEVVPLPVLVATLSRTLAA